MNISEHIKRATVSGALGVTIRIDVTTTTREAAQALAGALPKSVRATSFPDGVAFYVQLWSDGANGGTNETGVKRLRSMVKNLRKLGIELEHFDPRGGNQITAAELAELIA